MARLGVNIDHVATLRNARGGHYPSPLKAAQVAEAYGADGITVHLREDRRHIKDEDLSALRDTVTVPMNLEMANTDEMVAIALKIRPHMVTLVPERREEVTTEGGLDVLKHAEALKNNIARLRDACIDVSLFIDPDLDQVEASHAVGAPYIELHTGQYCEAFTATGKTPKTELKALIDAAERGLSLGLKINAGHGLNYDNVSPILAIPGLDELNIGHSIIAESVFIGLGPAVARMKQMIN